MVSGAGRKVFQPGEVLTASNVQNYLMDQAVQVYAGTAARGSAIGTATTEGMMSYLADTNSVQMATGTATWVNVDGVPIVAGTATRDALYPSPVPGNIVFRSDSLQRETYYAAAGTPTRSAGWYSGQDGGLVPIIPTSVTVGSGSATVSGNGVVTVSGANTTVLNDVFTGFDAYRVVITGMRQTSAGVAFLQLALAGTRRTTSTYGYGSHYAANSGSSGVLTSNGTTSIDFIRAATSTANQAGASFDVIDPNNTNATKFFGNSWGPDGSVFIGITFRGIQTDSTAFDGLAIVAGGGGNATFKIQVYGYRN